MKWMVGLALAVAGPAVADCGSDTGPCTISEGEYHAVLPAEEPADGQTRPVVVFLHGAGGTGAGTLRNTTLTEGLTKRGYAVLAPTASRQFGDGKGRSWNFFPGWTGRDETAFLQSVVQDASTRFGTDTENVLLSGFSAGAFMVTYLACDTPENFAAYAPVSGGFWRPQPENCAGPVNLFQTHGWRDSVVPLEGRFLGGGRYQQGDILAGLELWRATNSCLDEKPQGFEMTGAFWRRSWDCDGVLEFALFPGGHSIPKGWPDMVLDWFEALEP